MIKVLGDIILDRWIIGHADRISPEAAVPVLLESNKKYSLGGAGNLALNIASLGNDIELYGSLATDREAFTVLQLIGETAINSNITLDRSITTTKTRLVDHKGQHIVRWDREEIVNSPPSLFRLSQNIKDSDIVCISDYNKGVIPKHIMSIFDNRSCKVLVDPKQSPEIYKGAFLVKPNMKEYIEWFGEFNHNNGFVLLKDYNWDWLVITDGPNGIHVLGKNNEYHHYIEHTDKVIDITGAGDTVLAIIAHGIEKGMTVPESCSLACYGATRIVEKKQVGIITLEDLTRNLIWTNGVFDILHVGHLRLLKYAKSLGERLVVGLNSDSSVKRIKGNDRPINNQNRRKEALLELGFVDEVVIFNEDTPYNYIKKLRPDIIVKGGDYTKKEVIGHNLAKIELFPFVSDYSTTNIIEEIRK